jgi:hypothetical protein
VFSLPTLIKVLTLLAGAVIPGLCMFLVPKINNIPYAVSNIFGALVPSLLLGFSLYGICPMLLLKWKMNLDILSKTYRIKRQGVDTEKLVVYVPSSTSREGSKGEFLDRSSKDDGLQQRSQEK